MKTNRLYSLMVFLLLMVVGMQAQERNVLYIPELEVEAGKSFQMPVYVENTNPNITALQFTIEIPKEVTIMPEKATLSERATNHKLAYRQNNDTLWTLMLYSEANTPLVANTGIVLNIPSRVSNIVEGDMKPLAITKAVLSDSLGHNVLTDCYVVAPPDFAVTDIKCDLTVINPGDSVNIEWIVRNIGGVPTTSGWSERIYMVLETGDEQLLSSVDESDEILAANSSTSRKTGIRLSRLLGFEGRGNIKVVLTPKEDSGEHVANRGNNTAESEKNSITVNKRLYVSLPEKMDEPDQTTSIQLKVERSGSRKNELPIAITKVGDNRISIPEQTVIPKNSSGSVFYLNISGNDLLDDDSLFSITISADGYESINRQIVLVDDELPQLSIKAEKSEIKEGESIQMTITNQRAPKSDLTINVRSDLSDRLKFPSTIVMKAGQTTATFVVEALQNTEITDTLTAAIQVTADKHWNGECLVFLIDDDMPELELELKPLMVSESGGPNCIFGKITRKTNTKSRIKIRLKDDSDGQLYYSYKELEMAANQTTVEFMMGVIDNAVVDGERHYTVTASIYMPLCECSAKSSSIGSVSQQITVTDDDGPALKLITATTSFKEGEEGVLTLSHNTATDKGIAVNLNSDFDSGLEYNHNVTIPAGQNSVNVAVKVKNNDVVNDTKVVAFQCEAEGYASGACWVQITDQTLPDATISSIEVTPTAMEVGEKATVNITVKNVGNAAMSAGVPVNIYLDNKKKPTTSLQTTGKIEVGEELLLTTEITMPDKTGRHSIKAVINENHLVDELTYANNTSIDVWVNLLPAFTADAHVEKSTYNVGETAVISGKVTGTKIANVEVEVYTIHNGYRQSISTKTDYAGNYTVGWSLTENQSGHFVAGACYPEEELCTEMTSFDVYGIKFSDNKTVLYPVLGNVYKGKLTLYNLASLEQTGLKIEQKAESANCDFNFTVPEKIDANGSVTINYEITPTAVSEGTSWQLMPIQITTNEGSVANHTIRYYVKAPVAVLQTNTRKIITTMIKNATRDYPIVVRNTGQSETGKITLNLPIWMSTATPREMASLEQGDSVTIILRFSPTDNMKLNIPVEGTFAVNCEKGNGLSVPFSITPVSESKGRLTVDVVDEFTFYNEDKPHVEGATVQVKNAALNSVVAQGVSGSDGKITFELLEGEYEVAVIAEGHEDYLSNVIMVNPERETNKEVFVSCENVSYNFDVVETEIEDVYEIETEVKYDVRVPKPVLLVTLRGEQPQPGSVIPIEVVNKGFINAVDVNVSLACSGSYDIEFLNSSHLDVLAPQQTEVFYAKLNAKEAGSRKLTEGDISEYECEALIAKVTGYYLCGDIYSNQITGQDLNTFGKCFSGYSGRWSGLSLNWSSGGSGGGNGGGGGGDTNYIDGPFLSGTKDGEAQWWQNFEKNRKKICNKRFPYDPENPENPNAPNDPVHRDILDAKAPHRLPCDSGEEPVLVYKLVPVEGTRYEMEGVAADGVSQVKIVLDPDNSWIPMDDCDNITNVKWELSRELGKIEGNSLEEAIYTAPDSFPSKTGAVATVEATVRYTVRTAPNVTWGRNASVTIKIIRPPVVFIHGLGDSQKCWKEMDEMLINPAQDGSNLNTALYLEGINYRADYKKTNTSSFHVNVPVIYSSILKTQRRALVKGYVATKCDLVGHSMGGILSRLYVQDGGDASLVNRIITVNTPHAGSEIADCIVEHKYFLSNLAQTFFTHQQHSKGFDIQGDLGAIRDLAVMSDAMINLNADLKQKPDVPVYSIATELDYSSRLLQSIGNEAGLALSAASLTASLFTCPWYVPMVIAAATYGIHIVNDDLSQVGVGDFVVSTESQIGGCESYKTIKESGTAQDINQAVNFIGLNGLSGLMPHMTGNVSSVLYSILNEPWHCKSPSHYDVMNELSGLLSKNAKNPVFSRMWFKPESRTFSHDFMWAVNVASSFIPSDLQKLIEMNYTKPLKLSKVAGDILKVELNLVIGTIGLLESGYDYVKGITNNSARRMASSQMPTNENRFVRLELNVPEGYSNPLVTVAFGDDIILTGMGDNIEFKVPPTFYGDAEITIFMKNEDDKIVYEEYLYMIEQSSASPISIRADETIVSVGEEESLRLLCTWDDGSETFVDADNMTFETDGIARFEDNMITGVSRGYTEATVSFMGLTCKTAVRVFPNDNDTELDDDEQSDNVCSTVSLSFKQQMVMTRQAFRGTLTVNNGHTDQSLKDFKVNLEIRDSDGNLADISHQFQINPESLDGFEGELAFDAGWILPPNGSGTATILFIPTKFAAETEPKEWSFGGTISYTDPATGLTMTHELWPTTLTVNPTPQLEMNYFMQRDVLGDDALTEDIVEPTVPAEFSLLIHNIGYGDATNVRMVTNQPEIIDNEKGLLINFDILSSQLNGGDKTLALGQSVATDFGTIKAGQTTYAQWWFTSSLTGHFSEYDIKATHVTSYGNPDLSLIDTVLVHELIHTLNIPGMDMTGWMVNDVADSQDLPDMLYLADGTKETVSQTTAIILETGNSVYTLTVTPGSKGWNYGSVADPTAGQKLLNSIIRQSDGKELSLQNFWQTDRTLRDRKNPLYEFRLHFADKIEQDTESYLLTFVDRPVNATIILDEDDTTLPPTSDGVVNVKVKRTIKANEWSTICLPFAMNEQQVNVAFGEDAELCDFDGYELLDNGSTINVRFMTVSAIEANHPYIIKVTEGIDEFSVNDVVVMPMDKPMKNLGTVDNPKAMVGNYINGAVLKQGTLFLYGGKFYYSVGKTKMQGFRAFFDFDDKLIGFNANARIVMTIDGIDTAINKVVQGMTEGDTNGRTHNLSGQRVVNPGKGVYIVNSRKMVIK